MISFCRFAIAEHVKAGHNEFELFVCFHTVWVTLFSKSGDAVLHRFKYFIGGRKWQGVPVLPKGQKRRKCPGTSHSTSTMYQQRRRLVGRDRVWVIIRVRGSRMEQLAHPSGQISDSIRFGDSIIWPGQKFNLGDMTSVFSPSERDFPFNCGRISRLAFLINFYTYVSKCFVLDVGRTALAARLWNSKSKHNGNPVVPDSLPERWASLGTVPLWAHRPGCHDGRGGGRVPKVNL